MQEKNSLTYFRGQFQIDGKSEELVIVIDGANRKIVFCDYADQAKEIAKQMEERYIEGDLGDKE